MVEHTMLALGGGPGAGGGPEGRRADESPHHHHPHHHHHHHHHPHHPRDGLTPVHGAPGMTEHAYPHPAHPHPAHHTHPDHPHPAARPDSNDQMPVLSGEIEPSVCAGCGGRIIDRYYLLAVDKQWHVNCLKCTDCSLTLDSELTCFAKDGSIFCKEDYYRRFAVKRCSRCQLGISASELVMRAREHVFHIQCFTCASCTKTLTTGDYFGMKDALIYCRTHYELLIQGGDYLPEMSPPLPAAPHPGPMPYYNGVGTTHKGRPRKRKSHDHDSDCLQQLGLSNENDLGGMDGYGHMGSQVPRQKRVRTSFKHHQLRTMKSYFALNHNPDAKDLKQLAQKTGLSKRVLQVWFQNARAKYRRNVMKQQSDGPGAGGGGRDSTGSGGSVSGLGSGGDGHCGGSGGGSGKLGDPASPSGTHLTEISNSRSPAALSDISSSPSLSDLHNSLADTDHNSSGSSLTELFTNSINAMN